ncbi:MULTISPECIES: site-2 protease family protein [unclassified Paenibacillus]|uniref:site-2 protease family protein n=1 Tax=unclassified Paenibacillus TaxID=185978 RepID=UPI000CFA8200|nr:MULTISPECIES: site-2 protease family protein [unclassified Paenibacillus]PRA05558.1 site-2 protease family protein [Paenibacillus sp. MYb63]PRA50091.1 site-2 protease family protein [Paenibacillus sp. MYb67]QZN75437.1 site-2 protease family protein [Paenibacillus sp. DR312]
MDFWNSFFRYPIDQLPFFLLTILIAFTVHEFSHAYFANKFGDPTAKLLGRVTLNPVVHFDLFGVLLLIIAGFGWARPVPVNRANFDKPRLMGIIVSAAGPLSNLLLAIIGTIIYASLVGSGALGGIDNERLLTAITTFFAIFNLTNFFLFLFNLIPLPPLDGYRILEDLVPPAISRKLQGVEQWSIFIFLLILVIPPLQNVTIQPLYGFAQTMYVDLAKLVIELYR